MVSCMAAWANGREAVVPAQLHMTTSTAAEDYSMRVVGSVAVLRSACQSAPVPRRDAVKRSRAQCNRARVKARSFGVGYQAGMAEIIRVLPAGVVATRDSEPAYRADPRWVHLPEEGATRYGDDVERDSLEKDCGDLDKGSEERSGGDMTRGFGKEGSDVAKEASCANRGSDTNHYTWVTSRRRCAFRSKKHNGSQRGGDDKDRVGRESGSAENGGWHKERRAARRDDCSQRGGEDKDDVGEESGSVCSSGFGNRSGKVKRDDYDKEGKGVFMDVGAKETSGKVRDGLGNARDGVGCERKSGDYSRDGAQGAQARGGAMDPTSVPVAEALPTNGAHGSHDTGVYRRNMDAAEAEKRAGNTAFHSGRWTDAGLHYSRAAALVGQCLSKAAMADPASRAEFSKLTVDVVNNVAMNSLKEAEARGIDGGPVELVEMLSTKALMASERVLQIDPLNVKAKFRKASAQALLGNTIGAMNTAAEAIALDPGNKALDQLIWRLCKGRTSYTGDPSSASFFASLDA
mmetsp:Transcript_78830/g.255693  ORF Transcript_78830/g.255693 Transcript_78830/m.255693 type:complete len:518 (+) Transcript_78830:51-1604(+)